MGSRTERYRAIVEILSVHGFGFAVQAMGATGRFPFRRGLPGHERGRVYAQPEHLRLALEELGPTFVKLGQILSTHPDLLPPEYVAELARLQDAVAPVPVQVILDAVSEELGDDAVLEAFDATPVAGASIGQVHAAEVRGVEAVVKVRRPGVVETVATDLEIIENLAVRASRHWEVARDRDIVGIAREFATTFRNELDYLREAHNAERFAANFADDPEVHIPAVFWEATTSRVLTLERIGGIKIDDLAALDAAGVDRRALAARATRVLCTMVFQDGFFHADPHPGNFFVEPDGSLGIIDFGMVGELDDSLREQLAALLVALTRADLDRTTEELLELAGAPDTVDRAALRADLAPLVSRFGGLSLAELGTSETINGLLAIIRRHHLRIPHDLALLFKALVMAEGLGQRLDPDFRIAAVLAPFAERLALRRLAPDAIARRIVTFAHDLLHAGAETPRSLRGLASVLERGGFDVHLRTAELQQLARQADRTGNRLIAGVIAAALINGVGQIVAADPGRWSAMRGPLVVAGAGGLGALGAYLARTSHHQGDHG